MKNLKLLAAAVAVVLAGCAQTPDSVRSSAEKDSKERNEITAMQYISSNELSDDIDNALDKSYTQFDLRENISVKLPEDYCEVDFTQISDYEENYEKIMTRIFGKDVLDRENTVHDETGDGMVSYSFSDDDGKMYGCVGCPSGKIGLLSSMFTNPNYRRNGIAKELLSRIVNEAKQYGCGTIQITASDMGVKLYTDFGFEHNGNFMQYKLS